MRTETKVIDAYKFAELSDEAKEKAINNWLNGDMYDWWENVYKDAANVGIKITGFDIDGGSYCNIEFDDSVCDSAEKIKSNHGESCESWKTANDFLVERDSIVSTWGKDEDGELINEGDLDEKLDDIEDEFKKSISEDYRIMLQKKYEYLTSREYAIESIKANDYEFTEDGEMY